MTPAGCRVVAGNSIPLMNDTDMVINRLIADINAARQHVHLLFYILQGRQRGVAHGQGAGPGVASRRGVPRAGRRRLARGGCFDGCHPGCDEQGVRIFPVLPANALAFAFRPARPTARTIASWR